MERAQVVELREAREPVLVSDALGPESVLYTHVNVDLYDGDSKLEDRRGGRVLVTSHRLLFVCSREPRLSAGWWIDEVERVESVAPFFLRHGKAVVFIQSARAPVKLSCQEGNHTSLLAALESARRNRVQARETKLREEEEARKRESARVGTSGATFGLRGVLDHRRGEIESVVTRADESLRDLESLRENAISAAKLVKELLAKQARSGGGGDGGGGAGGPEAGPGGGAGEDELVRLDRLSLDMGLANPVTRASAGSLFHRELAAEVATFAGYETEGVAASCPRSAFFRPPTTSLALRSPLLRVDYRSSIPSLLSSFSFSSFSPILRRQGGMVMLTDLYCLYNRRRVTDLVSPEDLVKACLLFPEVRAPVHYRVLEGGVAVVCSADHSDEAVRARIVELLQLAASPDHPHPHLTAGELASRWSIPFAIAQQYILVRR